jgi:hypothetical protein
MSVNTITSDALIQKYLPTQMEKYFYKKLKNEKEEYVKLKVGELLKYLSMCHYTFGDIPFNDEIDEVWHLWILQTVQYQALTETLPSKRFINHCSNDYVDEKSKATQDENDINNQISYLVSYVVNFGAFTASTVIFWPMANTLMKLLNFNLDELNRYLLDLIVV